MVGSLEQGACFGFANRIGKIEQVLAVAEHLDTVNLPADRASIEGLLDRSERSFTNELATSKGASFCSCSKTSRKSESSAPR